MGPVCVFIAGALSWEMRAWQPPPHHGKRPQPLGPTSHTAARDMALEQSWKSS